MPGRVDLKDFVAGFLVEAEEHLHSVNRNLVAASQAQKGGRPEPRAVRELFRSLHTIKGLASMVGAEPVVDVSHEMEGILRAADRSGGRLSEDALDLLLQGTRAIEERIHAIANQGIAAVPPAPPRLLEALALAHYPEAGAGERPGSELSLPEEIRASLSLAEREQVSQATRAGHRAVLVEFQPSPERAARGINITAVRGRLAQLGELVKVIPRSSTGAPTGVAFSLLLATRADDSALGEAVGGSSASVRDVSPAMPDDAAAPAVPEPAADVVPSDHSIRVDVRKLDEAIEQLSALVVTRFKMARVAADLGAAGVDTRELSSIIAENARQLKRLRASIAEARMVPLAELLQRLPLVVRGLTKDTNKSVDITIQSGSTEVDKAVADKIFPALVHLVRNAVDHAIEPREERKQRGKPESGALCILCDDSSGTTLVLTVEDDGRGIDRDAVAARLGRAKARTDDELLQQITSPGLSTREDITRTSGRGMGMDIVKRTVEALGGTLVLRTIEGKGTMFTVRVPVSITIVDVFSFVSGGQVFVAPVAMVDEILEIEPSRVVKAPAPAHAGSEACLIQRRGEAIPLLALDALLGVEPGAGVPPKALVVHRSGEAVALGVERMLGQQEAVVRPLDDALIRVRGVTGATDLGDGKPTLVLDLAILGTAFGENAPAPP